jgi:hypothetical protein
MKWFDTSLKLVGWALNCLIVLGVIIKIILFFYIFKNVFKKFILNVILNGNLEIKS